MCSRKTISNIMELERFMANHPDTAKLPAKQKHIKKVMKVSSKVQCDRDEVLVLRDSGSMINTTDIAAHFPAYETFIMPSLGHLPKKWLRLPMGRNSETVGNALYMGKLMAKKLQCYSRTWRSLCQSSLLENASSLTKISFSLKTVAKR